MDGLSCPGRNLGAGVAAHQPNITTRTASKSDKTTAHTHHTFIIPFKLPPTTAASLAEHRPKADGKFIITAQLPTPVSDLLPSSGSEQVAVQVGCFLNV